MGRDNDRPPSLEDLRAGVERARAEGRATPWRRRDLPGEPRRGALALALRIGIELVAALAVGVFVGLVLDRWLGTMPLFLVLFFGLGAAAGVLNVYRAVAGIGYGDTYRRKPGTSGGSETQAGGEADTQSGDGADETER